MFLLGYMKERILLDKYEIIRELGRGGMATVYLAIDKQLKREVAIKMLHPHMNQEEHILRFEREAIILANLSHPNILNIYEFFEYETNYYIVYEYINGQTLGDFLDKYSIKYPVIALMISYKIIEAIEYTHQNGIIHRDIKPDNIMISQDGQVKVMDFGIAKVLTNITVTDTGALLGSPAYMSPEQVMGGEITFKSDIFSIGVLTYKLLTNISPFASNSTASTLKNVLNSDYSQPVHPLIDKGIERIIEFALNKDPNKRIKDLKTLKGIIKEKIKSEGKSKNFSKELASFFEAPDKYQKNLKHELLEHYKESAFKMYKEKNILKALNFCGKALELNPEDAKLKSLINKLKIFNNGKKIRLLISYFVIMNLILFTFINITFFWQKNRSHEYKLNTVDSVYLNSLKISQNLLNSNITDLEYAKQIAHKKQGKSKLKELSKENEIKIKKGVKTVRKEIKKVRNIIKAKLKKERLRKEKLEKKKLEQERKNDKLKKEALKKEKIEKERIAILEKAKPKKYGSISYCFRPYATVLINGKKYNESCINKSIKLQYGKYLIKAKYPYSNDFKKEILINDKHKKLSIRYDFNQFSKVYLKLKSIGNIYISLKDQHGKYVRVKNSKKKYILLKNLDPTKLKLFFINPGKYYLDITNKDVFYKNLYLNISKKRAYNITMDLENDKNIKIQ